MRQATAARFNSALLLLHRRTPALRPHELFREASPSLREEPRGCRIVRVIQIGRSDWGLLVGPNGRSCRPSK